MFDTLSVSRKLTAAGFDLKQADALVESLAHAMDDTVATKADVADLKASITVMQGDLTRLFETAVTKAEIVRLESKMETEVASLESKMEIKIASLETKVETEVAGLKVEIVQGFEEINKRVTHTVFGVAVVLSAVIALLRLLL